MKLPRYVTPMQGVESYSMNNPRHSGVELGFQSFGIYHQPRKSGVSNLHPEDCAMRDGRVNGVGSKYSIASRSGNSPVVVAQ